MTTLLSNMISLVGTSSRRTVLTSMVSIMELLPEMGPLENWNKQAELESGNTLNIRMFKPGRSAVEY